MAANIESLVESISKLTVLEASELYTQLKEKLNLPDVVAAAPAAEAKSAFDVVLTDGGSNKIAVIKEVRALVSGLGLAEAKALVEGAPKPLLTGVPEAQAKEAAEKIKAAGGKAEVK